MDTLRRFVARLRPLRWLLALMSLLGLCAVGLILLLVPSQLGFVLAGPLVIAPWCLMSIAYARAPTDQQILFMLCCGTLGLAWPLLYL